MVVIVIEKVRIIHMKDVEKRLAAKKFIEYWKDKGYER